jgi:polar amino acid transport system substrate-binding protein
LLTLALVLLALAACGSRETPSPAPIATPVPATATSQPPSPTPEPPDLWEEIQAEGRMVVGTSADYAPYEFYNDSFQMDGFDISLMSQIAARLGVELELVDIAFDGLLPAVQIGQVDAAIAAIAITPQRMKEVDFSNVYFVGADAFVAAPNSTVGPIRTVKDLASYRVGVQAGSIYETWLERELLETGLMDLHNLFIYRQIENGFDDLKAGHVDVLAMDRQPAQLASRLTGIRIVGEQLNRQHFAIAVPLGQNNLRRAINRVLAELQNEGAIAQTAAVYLELNPTDVEPLPTPLPEPTPGPVPPTPAPPAGCHDGMAWVSDLNYDDNNMKNPPVVQAGQALQKGWRIRNTGTCTWNSSYSLGFVQGNRPGADMTGRPTAVQGVVAPGQTYDMYVNLVAPTAPAVYQGFWQIRDGQGVAFGERVYVGVTVPPSTPPTPVPTQTPSPGITFTADRTDIRQGECVNFAWNVINVRAVYFYVDGQDYRQNGVAGQAGSQQCPAQSTTYDLRVDKDGGSSEIRQIRINVQPNSALPIIVSFLAEPSQINAGQCSNLRWDVQGNVNQVRLLRAGNPLWNGAPFRGNYAECPPGSGDIGYVLEASGPGGTTRATLNLRLIAAQPTPTPPPQAPLITSFSASPQQINLGGCTTLSWSFSGQSLAQTIISRDGAVIASEIGQAGSLVDCPPSAGQIIYLLKVDSEFGGTAQQGAQVSVVGAAPTATPAVRPPTIEYFAVTSDGTNPINQINSGECVFLTWNFFGDSLAATTLFRNGEIIASDFTASQSFQDCPPVGVMNYQLKVDSEFGGSSTRDVQLTVVAG